MSFANTNDLKANLNLELDAVETASRTNDDAKLYWCVAYYSETTTNPMDGSTTVTTYYACTEISL